MNQVPTLMHEKEKIINGRYILHEEIGRGGMGIVYRATDRLTGDTVALKQVLIGEAENNEAYRLALAQEFQILAGLRHPNIISVLDYGFDSEKRPFFTMAYLPEWKTILEAAQGESLERKIELIQQLLQALAYLHRRGVFHRDIKPDNVLVVDGDVRVLDFGLSFSEEQASSSFAGTPIYLAPELFEGAEYNTTSDLYAVGVILYQLLAGKHPFEPFDFRFVDRVLDEAANLELVDDRIRPLLTQLLAKTPEGRPGSARVTLTTLAEAIGQSQPTESEAIRESYLQAAKFVGREDEMAQLTEALEKAGNGNGSAWLIGGESGVGKSRLLQEFETQALVAGFMVLRGQAVADNSGLPYQIWLEPLRHLLLSADNVDDLTAGTLLSLIPDISQLLGRDVNPLPNFDEHTIQQQIISAIIRLFEQQNQPVLLLVEDLHWAKDGLAIFPHLTSKITASPLIIVGTYRIDETPILPEKLPSMHPMLVKRLSEAAIASLSESMLTKIGTRPDLMEVLQNESEGNAFFLVELVRMLAEEAGQLDVVREMPLPQKLLPNGIQTIIARRFSRIPKEDHRLLQLSAIAGREIDLSLLSQFTQNQPFEAWLTACAEAMVLEVQNGRWRFSHDKIREGILDELPLTTRRKLHQQVAQALEAIYAHRDDYAAQLAYHWQQVGHESKERTYAFVAGKLAAKQYRNQDALLFFQRAYELMPKNKRVEQIQCLLAQEKIYHFLGDRAAQDDLLSTLKTLAYEENNPDLLAEVIFRDSHYSFFKGDVEQALKSTKIALEYAQIADNLSVQGMANRSFGNVYYGQGKSAEAAYYFELSAAQHEQENELSLSAINLMFLGSVTSHYMGNHVQAQQILIKAANLLEQFNIQIELSLCLGIIAYEKTSYGDIAGAEAAARRGMALAKAADYKTGLGMCYLALGKAALAKGECSAQALLDQSITLLKESKGILILGLCLRNAGNVALINQDYDAAKEYFSSSLQIYTGLQNSGEIAINQMGLASVAMAQGEPFEEELAAVLAYWEDNPYFSDTAEPFFLYAQVYQCLQALGDDLAQRMVDEAQILLHKRAKQFTDSKHKSAYLALPQHQNILHLYAAMAEIDG